MTTENFTREELIEMLSEATSNVHHVTPDAKLHLSKVHRDAGNHGRADELEKMAMQDDVNWKNYVNSKDPNKSPVGVISKISLSKEEHKHLSNYYKKLAGKTRRTSNASSNLKTSHLDSAEYHDKASR